MVATVITVLTAAALLSAHINANNMIAGNTNHEAQYTEYIYAHVSDTASIGSNYSNSAAQQASLIK